MVEEVILANRKHQVEVNNKKWEELSKKRDHEEKANSEQRSEDYWNFVQDMDNLNRDFQELYFGTTVQLENDCDELQRELERIKVEAIMNSEKLDYNYQILKKRETENIIIRSQQKRRINKLQDTINSQKKKNNEYHTQTMQEIEKLTAEVKKLCKNILEIEKQADHIAAVNNMKFKNIWDMNKARADNLFQRILDIDKILYEQQLGLLWKAPEPKVESKSEMNSSTTGMSQTSSKLSSKQVQVQLQLPQQQSKMGDELTVETVETITNPTTDNENNLFYKRALNQVLNLLADKTGFLIEEQLNAILEPYLEYEKTLVKVDNVFTALKIEERSDIDLLFEYFLPYMFCPICSVAPEKIIVVGEDESLMGILEMDPSTYAELNISDSKTKANEAATAVAEMLKNIAGADHERGGTVIEFGPLSVILYDDNLKGECRGPDKIQDEVSVMILISIR
ncbi:hypothetical protein GEV33_000894 [Tenebrio molitor]|uniref:Uncharacterized protein n=1 Tax=Tenebrio molitor TaxID=7067 RepID=A0A8J6HWL8_TENMO|nr:hypothetical protein GEV33_000894 [Tenebrio molitor]